MGDFFMAFPLFILLYVGSHSKNPSFYVYQVREEIPPLYLTLTYPSRSSKNQRPTMPLVVIQSVESKNIAYLYYVQAN